MKKKIILLFLLILLFLSSCYNNRTNSDIQENFPNEQYVPSINSTCNINNSQACMENPNCTIKGLDDVLNDDVKPWTCCSNNDLTNYNITYNFSDPCSWQIP
jgi:hypothetical protein